MFVNSIDGICQDKEGNLLYEVRQIGSQGDGYWSAEDVVDHAREVVAAMKERFPFCRIVVITDNSPAHSSHAPDSLRTTTMRRGPGGKNPVLRSSTIQVFKEVKNFTPGMDWSKAEFIEHKLSHAFHQEMNDEIKQSKTSSVRIIPKGLEIILTERIQEAKCENNLKQMNVEDLKHYLAKQPDFLESKTELEDVIEEEGGICIYLPRFHPELNVIGTLSLSLSLSLFSGLNANSCF